mmetsp:Transcript_23238/g.80959  ORF Transcript_23238/g.80959 Transcript_23238/m.80959 type:complete len:282 (+) Transcript_23238:5886-6731(+)
MSRKPVKSLGYVGSAQSSVSYVSSCGLASGSRAALAHGLSLSVTPAATTRWRLAVMAAAARFLAGWPPVLGVTMVASSHTSAGVGCAASTQPGTVSTRASRSASTSATGDNIRKTPVSSSTTAVRYTSSPPTASAAGTRYVLVASIELPSSTTDVTYAKKLSASAGFSCAPATTMRGSSEMGSLSIAPTVHEVCVVVTASNCTSSPPDMPTSRMRPPSSWRGRRVPTTAKSPAQDSAHGSESASSRCNTCTLRRPGSATRTMAAGGVWPRSQPFAKMSPVR